jgi:hypothetical protein
MMMTRQLRGLATAGLFGREGRMRAGRRPWKGDAPPEGGPQVSFDSVEPRAGDNLAPR